MVDSEVLAFDDDHPILGCGLHAFVVDVGRYYFARFDTFNALVGDCRACVRIASDPVGDHTQVLLPYAYMIEDHEG